MPSEPLVDEVGRRCPGGPVIDADVGDSLAQGDVGDQGDDRNARVMQPPDGVDDLGFVGGLEDDSLGAAATDVVERLRQFAGPGLLPEVEPRSHSAGRSMGSSSSRADFTAAENRSGVCMTTSTMKVRPLSRSWLRCRSRSAIACATFAAVLARTPGRLLSTRSTVASLNPDCRAISRIG